MTFPDPISAKFNRRHVSLILWLTSFCLLNTNINLHPCYLHDFPHVKWEIIRWSNHTWVLKSAAQGSKHLRPHTNSLLKKKRERIFCKHSIDIYKNIWEKKRIFPRSHLFLKTRILYHAVQKVFYQNGKEYQWSHQSEFTHESLIIQKKIIRQSSTLLDYPLT